MKERESLIFEKSEGKEINKNKKVKIIKCNHIIEVVSVLKDNSNSLQNIVKLNKNEYCLLDTGEIKEYVKTENRSENLEGIKGTFKNLRRLINSNFEGGVGEKHIILTYKENMTDLKRLHADYKRFWEKFKYAYPESEYISVAEPQGRGAWHLHVLMKTNEPFIKNTDISKMWGQGYTKTLPLEQVDNIGAYLSAYFTDLEIEQEEKITGKEKIKDVEGKSYIKGARLKLYPSGMKIYRTSSGIKKPVEEKIQFSDIKKITGSATPSYSMTVSIKNSDGSLLNQIDYQQYNLKRLKIQEEKK